MYLHDRIEDELGCIYMASLCYGKAGLIAICAVVTELKLIPWVTLHPTGYGISRLHLTIYITLRLVYFMIHIRRI